MATFNWGKTGIKAKGKTKVGGKSASAKLTKVNSHHTGAAKTVVKNSAKGLRNPKAPGKPVKGLNSKSIKYSKKNMF